MSRNSAKLRDDAARIWRAGVAAVLPDRLVPERVRVDREWLLVDDESIDMRSVNRVAIVGAGKGAGAMAVALEAALGERVLENKDVGGWVNIPADCLIPTQRVHLHPARAPGVNEPCEEGIEGARRILELATSLGPSDICFCLLTGGGSALLPAPVPEISLETLTQVTRLLSEAGANIEQLNTVRCQLSTVKGGGLARACRAGRLITLIISDVLGDRLDLIASGPTANSESTPADALRVLDDLKLIDEPSIESVVTYLRRLMTEGYKPPSPPISSVTNLILGNNAIAVDAAGLEAERLGYSHAMIAATNAEGAAEDVGRHLASMAMRMRDTTGPDCLISGGEPTVTLIEESRRGNGGRNQQLALAALESLGSCERICLLSAGTDGEDGPTDAAGAFVSEDVVRAARNAGLEAGNYLARNDAYNFFHEVGGLFATGPTQTNVCDLRVIVVDR
ncbi:MAG TPA: DUF4147 domain-containing protein [Lacipirellulaceae bacterium]|nr:DUF4147 domain-containing protein [Lacipirellulaceae bacterium]